MLSRKDIEDLLVDITYKPGWSFKTAEVPFEGLALLSWGPTIDSKPPHEPTLLASFSNLPPFNAKEDFFSWLQWRLNNVESHEAREWLKYKGEVIYNPHAKKKVVI